MALPLSPGSLPETATLVKNTWTKVAANVNMCKIHNKFEAPQIVWVTYVNVEGTAPIGITGIEDKIPEDYAQFEDGVTARDVYAYAVGANADIKVEA